MTLRFKSSQCVVVGTFNMYIIQPRWLMDRKIIPKSTQFHVEANLDEPGIKFTPPGDRRTWLVTPTKLTVLTSDPKSDCGPPVAKVLQKLPWTPLAAIGNNVEFVGGRSAASRRLRSIAKAILPSVPRDLGETEGTSYALSICHGDQSYRLNFAFGADDIRLFVNVHTNLKEKSGKFAGEVAAASGAHRRHAVKLVKHVLESEVVDG